MKTYYLYLIRNKTNNKVYIGKTSEDPERRFYRHRHLAKQDRGFYLHSAISVHGEENFELIVLGSTNNEAEINDLERLGIEIFKSTDREFGYNGTCGGDGGPHTDDAKRKMSIAATGRVLDEKTRNKIRLAHVGRPASEETKKKMSLAQTGKMRPTQSASMKAAWTRPGYRERVRQRIWEGRWKHVSERAANDY